MHISELHYLRLYLKNSWSRFAKNCPVGIFCEIMSSQEFSWRFHEFLSGVGRMIFSPEEHDGWVSLSPFWPLSTLKLLGEQQLQTLDSWSKLELKFSQIRKWTNEMRGIAPKAAKDHIFPEQYFKMTRTKKSHVYDVVESSYHKKPFFNKVISLVVEKPLKNYSKYFLLLVPLCLKITQKVSCVNKNVELKRGRNFRTVFKRDIFWHFQTLWIVIFVDLPESRKTSWGNLWYSTKYVVLLFSELA